MKSLASTAFKPDLIPERRESIGDHFDEIDRSTLTVVLSMKFLDKPLKRSVKSLLPLASINRL